MALDPAVLKARIDLRVCELKLLAAQTAVSWAQACERKEFAKGWNLRGLPPPGDSGNEIK